MDIIDNEFMSLTIDNFPNKETLENKAELYIFEYFEDIKSILSYSIFIERYWKIDIAFCAIKHIQKNQT